ncbi:MAG: flavin reductase [Planctomycetota bacterium]|nr:flavin reductase [Planctomycetota bacterium]
MRDAFENIPAGPMDWLPTGSFLITATHDKRSSGVIIKNAILCCPDPRIILVAMPSGRHVEPLMRDNRHFGLTPVSEDERLLPRAFPDDGESHEDKFLTIPCRVGPGGTMIPRRCESWVECEIIRHIDLEVGHRLWVGRVIACGEPAPPPKLRSIKAKSN